MLSATYAIISYIVYVWIRRAVESRLHSAKTRPMVVLTGARQTGKTSTFLRLFPKLRAGLGTFLDGCRSGVQ